MVSFDRTLAAALGYPVYAFDLLLLLLLTVTIVVSIQAVGIILVLAMLVTPAATARLLVDRFEPMIVLGAIIGAVVGVVGYYVSFYAGTASGATIVLLMTGVFLLRLRLLPAAWAPRPPVAPASRARGLEPRVRSARRPCARSAEGDVLASDGGSPTSPSLRSWANFGLG